MSALVDGAKARDYIHDGREIDLRVMGSTDDPRRTHLLDQLPIATPGGGLVTLGSVADVVEMNGPVQINHRERMRAVTLRITPEDERPLEEAMELVEGEVLGPRRAEGRLGGLAPREAIRTAVGNRVRPIFMSVSTSVFGMLPLVLFPGAGSELYRGLGSVVVGGLIVSTVFHADSRAGAVQPGARRTTVPGAARERALGNGRTRQPRRDPRSCHLV